MEFTAVEFMRKARNKISKDIQGISSEQEKEYLVKHNEWVTECKRLPQKNNKKQHPVLPSL